MPPPLALREAGRKVETAVVPHASLHRHATWMLLGNITTALSQWVILVIVARLGGSAQVGEYALALAVSAPIFVFAGLNLSNIQATDVQDRFAFGEYFALNIACLIAAVVASAAYAFWSQTAGGVAGIMLVVALIRAVEMLFDCTQATMRRHDAFDLVAKSNLAKGLVSMLVLLAGLMLTHSLLLALVAVAISWLGVLWWRDVRFLRRILDVAALMPKWRWKTLRHLAWLALPLGIAAVLNNLAANVPRYFLAHQLGATALGIFAPIAGAAVVIDLFVKSLAMSAMPRLARSHRSDPQAFARTLFTTLAVAAGIGSAALLAAWLCGPFVLLHVLGAQYSEHAPLLVGMVVAGTLSAMASVLSLAATSTRMYRTQMTVYTANLALVALLAYALVGRFGLWGAVLALGGSAAFRFAMYAFLLFVRPQRPCTVLAV